MIEIKEVSIMAMEPKYVCTGGCGGAVSAAEYAAGKTVCGTQGCPKLGQPFEKRMHCTECGADMQEGVAHQCGEGSAKKGGGLFSWLPWMK